LAVKIPAEERMLVSRMGNLLAQKSEKEGLRGAGALVYEEPAMTDSDTKYKISLRSLKNEDVSAVAKAFGGGGHLNASSFLLGKHEFEAWTKHL
jgi:nanoRNase/pAp phosphatase (c-di-AMP/oligoRNAs hydrolase)